jgi:hypothetical protein
VASLTVRFDVPAEVVFDYLVDPVNRPEWQASLKAVELLDDGPPHVGQRWYDVTRVPGVRPLLVLESMARPHVWVETGTWRGYQATLALSFEPKGHGCEVSASFVVLGSGLRRPLGPVLTGAGIPAVRHDLQKAARLLAHSSS